MSHCGCESVGEESTEKVEVKFQFTIIQTLA